MFYFVRFPMNLTLKRKKKKKALFLIQQKFAKQLFNAVTAAIFSNTITLNQLRKILALE